MRKILLTCCLLLLGLVAAPGMSAEVPLNKDPKVHFTLSGLDTNGNVDEYSKAEIVLVIRDGDPAKAEDLKVSVDVPLVNVGENVTQIKDSLTSLEVGSYDVLVRVFDVTGNASDWSERVQVKMPGADNVPPAKPANVRVTITIEVGG